jgi:uncharacterized protein
MLLVKRRELQDGPMPTTGELEPDDPTLEGLDLRLTGPVQVDGMLQETEDGSYLWRGHLMAELDGDCGRCLTDLKVTVDDYVDVLFSADPELAEDPSVYPLDPKAAVVDVRPAVREELILRVNVFPLCRMDCKGLCATCGADLNAGPCACAAAGSTN